MIEFLSVCPITVTGRGHLVGVLDVQERSFNSQLWGELPPQVTQKGLQPLTLSLSAYLIRVLFPSSLFLAYVIVTYSMA
jgi:hypothetical protein